MINPQTLFLNSFKWSTNDHKRNAGNYYLNLLFCQKTALNGTDFDAFYDLQSYFPLAYFLFTSHFCQVTKRALATKMEEYVPKVTPMSSANTNK